jgi:pilus assembly protein CpaF
MTTQPSVAPAPRMSSAPRPAPPAAARRPAPVASIGDEARRTKLTEVMRELSTRLVATLGLEGPGHDVASDEELWGRAERAASDLLEQLSADGALPAGVDSDALLKDVVAETVSVGPLEELLGDDAVREVTVARFDRLFVDRGGHLAPHTKWFSSGEAVTRAVERLLARAGQKGQLVPMARASSKHGSTAACSGPVRCLLWRPAVRW